MRHAWLCLMLGACAAGAIANDAPATPALSHPPTQIQNAGVPARPAAPRTAAAHAVGASGHSPGAGDGLPTAAWMGGTLAMATIALRRRVC